jgi:hypothetical protein
MQRNSHREGYPRRIASQIRGMCLSRAVVQVSCDSDESTPRFADRTSTASVNSDKCGQYCEGGGRGRFDCQTICQEAYFDC